MEYNRSRSLLFYYIGKPFLQTVKVVVKLRINEFSLLLYRYVSEHVLIDIVRIYFIGFRPLWDLPTVVH